MNHFKMWMMYEESNWPKAADLESTILRLEKTIDASYREFILNGNRPNGEMNYEDRKNRLKEFYKAMEAVENYRMKTIPLEDLINVLVQVKMQCYLTINHLPYYIVRRFNLDGMGFDNEDHDDSDQGREETCDCY